jgi:hypothetical protein
MSETPETPQVPNQSGSTMPPGQGSPNPAAQPEQPQGTESQLQQPDVAPEQPEPAPSASQPDADQPQSSPAVPGDTPSPQVSAYQPETKPAPKRRKPASDRTNVPGGQQVPPAAPPQASPYAQQPNGQYAQQPGGQYSQQPQQPGGPYVQQPGGPYMQQPGGQGPNGGKSKRNLILVVVLAAVAVVVLYIVLALTMCHSIEKETETTSDDYSYSNTSSLSFLTPTPTPASDDSVVKPYNPDDPDDGELHDGWNDDAGYTKTTQSYTYQASSEHVDHYDATFDIDFSVEYPQLSGDINNIDSINAQIRDTAMRYVNDTYLAYNADSGFVSLVKSAVSNNSASGFGSPNGNYQLSDEVDYAVTYNSPDIISVSFNDHFIAGSYYGEYLFLRTININLKTGEVYTMDNSLSMTEQIAREWVDNTESHANENGTSAVSAYGADETVKVLTGNSEFSNRYQTALFIDQDGKANVAVTFWFGGGESQIIVRGWWDVTPSSEALAAAKKPSTLWDVLPEQ